MQVLHEDSKNESDSDLGKEVKEQCVVEEYLNSMPIEKLLEEYKKIEEPFPLNPSLKLPVSVFM